MPMADPRSLWIPSTWLADLPHQLQPKRPQSLPYLAANNSSPAKCKPARVRHSRFSLVSSHWSPNSVQLQPGHESNRHLMSCSSISCLLRRCLVDNATTPSTSRSQLSTTHSVGWWSAHSTTGSPPLTQSTWFHLLPPQGLHLHNADLDSSPHILVVNL